MLLDAHKSRIINLVLNLGRKSSALSVIIKALLYFPGQFVRDSAAKHQRLKCEGPGTLIKNKKAIFERTCFYIAVHIENGPEKVLMYYQSLRTKKVMKRQYYLVRAYKSVGDPSSIIINNFHLRNAIKRSVSSPIGMLRGSSRQISS